MPLDSSHYFISTQTYLTRYIKLRSSSPSGPSHLSIIVKPNLNISNLEHPELQHDQTSNFSNLVFVPVSYLSRTLNFRQSLRSTNSSSKSCYIDRKISAFFRKTELLEPWVRPPKPNFELSKKDQTVWDTANTNTNPVGQWTYSAVWTSRAL